jgi:hypothetical protein
MNLENTFGFTRRNEGNGGDMAWVKAHSSPNGYLPYRPQYLAGSSVTSVPLCEMSCLG